MSKIYVCNHCKEEYPYMPVMCNDCGTPFSDRIDYIVTLNLETIIKDELESQNFS